MTGNGRLGVGEAELQTHVLGMVGDREEVERSVHQLHGAATHVVDGLALGKPVGIIGRGANIERKGIEGPRRVHVEVAEVGVSKRVGLDLRRRDVDHRRSLVGGLYPSTCPQQQDQADQRERPFHRSTSCPA